MDKKDRKRMEVLRDKQQRLQKQLAGAKRQTDEPEEINRLQHQLAEVEAEIDKIKNK